MSFSLPLDKNRGLKQPSDELKRRLMRDFEDSASPKGDRDQRIQLVGLCSIRKIPDFYPSGFRE
ncbi:MAG: hypothetical protein WC371_01830 [Parachlamydiales bacterium]|jgi:hypothetical protein